MSRDRSRLAAGGLVAAVFIVLSCRRSDLFQEALAVTLRQIERGGTARAKVLAEIALLGAILALTLHVVSRRIRWARDGAVALAALAAGWAVEAWGTRTGLWSYYTGERPPLWILPAWSLGALVIDRVSTVLRERWGAALSERSYRNGYLLLAGVCMAVCAGHAAPRLGEPWTWALLAGLAAALAVRSDARRDLWVLLAGWACVFFADLWGTTNACWRYAVQNGGAQGWAAGVAFGMTLDTTVVLGCLKLADLRKQPPSCR